MDPFHESWRRAAAYEEDGGLERDCSWLALVVWLMMELD